MARPNPKSRAKDMFLSLAVLMVPLVLLIAFFTLDPEPQAEAVDVAPSLERAEAESPYPVLRATNLPDGWTPVRAAWARDGSRWIDGEAAVGNAWQLGYMGPDEIYYGLEQRDRAVGQAITRLTREGSATGATVEAAGLRWDAYESKDGRTTSLVAKEGEMVAVASADTDLDALTRYVTTLSRG
ncbi:DUF4245 domain-containing protein [uncultured Tessaracoccus sp.]|uniref:DUF4245 domain-containing protein n=1 Tax=uncultured Tessaracoccus sp. TaxID=905023 RepID=UPI0025F877D4|nr:DUF4245 domain-containing protein [uncultured Tessaracoccus sp.]